MDTEQGRSWALLCGGLHRPSGSSSHLSPEMPAPPLPKLGSRLALQLGAWRSRQMVTRDTAAPRGSTGGLGGEEVAHSRVTGTPGQAAAGLPTSWGPVFSGQGGARGNIGASRVWLLGP